MDTAEVNKGLSNERPQKHDRRFAIEHSLGPGICRIGSAAGSDVTLADGAVTTRGDAVYFIVADKRAAKGYYEKGDITVTWYKFILADDNHPDDPGYQLTQAFTHSYPNSSSTVEVILGRELSMQPRKESGAMR